jgi:uncharacterized membrane protein
MDALYLFLKFLHVLAVIVWVGGTVALVAINAHLARTGDAAGMVIMGGQSDFFGRVAIGPAMVIALIAGVATAARIGFPFTSLWIIWGIAGFIISGGLVAAIGRSARELGELAPQAPPVDARVDTLRRRLTLLNTINLILLASVVWAMVFKPTL